MAKNIDIYVTQAEHDGLDHTGLTGVPAAEAFTSAAHEAIDHTGAPFSLLDETGHDALDHTGLTGAGKVVQTVFATPVTSQVTCSTVVPRDDTIPQSSEGQLVISATITPVSLSNTLIFNFEASGASATSVDPTVMLFDTASSSALAVRDAGVTAPGGTGLPVKLYHYRAVGSLSATTFDIRVGVDSGFFLINDSTLWGGVEAAVFTITEIAP